ncbi:unnamed protein product [Closterium sp. Yama58-4]|nr:unnamed protein product [Closterium sp. Yama58-4]
MTVKKCGRRFRDLVHRLPPYKPTGSFLVTVCNGGLNQQRGAIVNAVVLARFLNLTLVVPFLKAHPVWGDSSSFQDLFNLTHFESVLKSFVKVVTTIPEEAKQLPIHEFRPPEDALATLDWYVDNVKPSVQNNSIVLLSPFARRLGNVLPEPWQLLRCKVNYEGLRFVNSILVLGRKVIRRMKKMSSNFVSLHWRFETDAVAYSMCEYGGGEKEKLALEEYRIEHWDRATRKLRETLNPASQRVLGQCPMSAIETGIFMRAMGVRKSSAIYVATLERQLFGGNHSLQSLRSMFPNAVTKRDILTQGELGPLEERASALAAIDYIVSTESGIFIPTATGNFPNFVIGHRLYYGQRSIQPDLKKLALLYSCHHLSKEHDMLDLVRAAHEDRFIYHGRSPKSNFFANPEECLCPA